MPVGPRPPYSASTRTDGTHSCTHYLRRTALRERLRRDDCSTGSGCVAAAPRRIDARVARAAARLARLADAVAAAAAVVAAAAVLEARRPARDVAVARVRALRWRLVGRRLVMKSSSSEALPPLPLSPPDALSSSGGCTCTARRARLDRRRAGTAVLRTVGSGDAASADATLPRRLRVRLCGRSRERRARDVRRRLAMGLSPSSLSSPSLCELSPSPSPSSLASLVALAADVGFTSGSYGGASGTAPPSNQSFAKPRRRAA